MEIAKIVVGVVHILISIIIIALILLQSGKDAGMSGAVGGSADSFFGKNKGRTMDAMLSKFTKICAILFLITSLFLAYGDSVITKAPSEEVPVENVVPSVEEEAPIEGIEVNPVEEGEPADVTENGDLQVNEEAAAEGDSSIME